VALVCWSLIQADEDVVGRPLRCNRGDGDASLPKRTLGKRFTANKLPPDILPRCTVFREREVLMYAAFMSLTA
jgi:hypothetical protein